MARSVVPRELGSMDIPVLEVANVVDHIALLHRDSRFVRAVTVEKGVT